MARRRSRNLTDFTPVTVGTLFIGSGMARATRPGRPATVDPERFKLSIETITSRRFPGFTAVPGRGFWEGGGEPSMVVQVLCPGESCGNFARDLTCTAAEIAREIDQDAVGVMIRKPNGDAQVDFVPQTHQGACKYDAKAANDRRRRIRSAL